MHYPPSTEGRAFARKLKTAQTKVDKLYKDSKSIVDTVFHPWVKVHFIIPNNNWEWIFGKTTRATQNMGIIPWKRPLSSTTQFFPGLMNIFPLSVVLLAMFAAVEHQTLFIVGKYAFSLATLVRIKY